MYRLVVASLLLAVVLVALIARRGSPVRTRSVKVTARAALHRGAYLAVVEVEGKRLLIGAGSQHVTVLAELDPNPRATEQSDEPPTGTQGNDLGWLDRVRRATTRVPRGSAPS